MKNKKAQLKTIFSKKIGQNQSKKAQLKIQQMIFMVLAITLFFILAGLFFLSVRITNLEKDVIELNRDKAVALVNKLASNPEFIFENIPNAVDADKLMILKSEARYRDFFGVDGIIIEKVYPISDSVECTLSTYPDCNKIKIFTSKDSAVTSSFISLCTKETIAGNSYNKCELARLMIDEAQINEQ